MRSLLLFEVDLSKNFYDVDTNSANTQQTYLMFESIDKVTDGINRNDIVIAKKYKNFVSDFFIMKEIFGGYFLYLLKSHFSKNT